MALTWLGLPTALAGSGMSLVYGLFLGVMVVDWEWLSVPQLDSSVRVWLGRLLSWCVVGCQPLPAVHSEEVVAVIAVGIETG
jgi:hypothetical protein